jgi:hypothetical protein
VAGRDSAAVAVSTAAAAAFAVRAQEEPAEIVAAGTGQSFAAAEPAEPAVTGPAGGTPAADLPEALPDAEVGPVAAAERAVVPFGRRPDAVVRVAVVPAPAPAQDRIVSDLEDLSDHFRRVAGSST